MSLFCFFVFFCLRWNAIPTFYFMNYLISFLKDDFIVYNIYRLYYNVIKSIISFLFYFALFLHVHVCVRHDTLMIHEIKLWCSIPPAVDIDFKVRYIVWHIYTKCTDKSYLPSSAHVNLTLWHTTTGAKFVYIFHRNKYFLYLTFQPSMI